MSRQVEEPQDWRRRRRRPAPPPTESAEERTEASGEEGTEVAEEVVTSRTLFSFLEPVLDAVGSFSKPVVIAGILSLFIGAALSAFVVSMRPYGMILIGLGVLLLGVMGLIFISAVFAAFISRTGRYGVNSLIMLAAFIGILFVLNFITFGSSLRVDTTATNQFSLDSDTKVLLDELQEPVRAIAFFRKDISGQDEAELRQLLRKDKVADKLQEFHNRSGKFTYEFQDPELVPDLARKYGITRYESIVLIGEGSGLVDTVQPTDEFYSQLEQDLYTGILVATGQEQRNVYFLAGHGEPSINNSGGDGFSAARLGLEGDNYRVQSLVWNLADEEVVVPDDAALVVIAGPTGELPPAHAEALNLYLEGKKADETPRQEGGRLIFLAEPTTPDSFKEFLGRWGVFVDDGYILDQAASTPGSPHTLRLTNYNPGAPTQIVFPQGTPLNVVLMPGVASLLPVPDAARQFLPIAATTTDSYLVATIEQTEPITDAGPDSDPRGPFLPVLYVQAAGPVGTQITSRPPSESEISGLIVFGDSDFVKNNFFGRGSGAALFLNSANYLLGDFSLVSIRDRQVVFREWNLDQNELKFVRFSSWFFLPGLMALMAALVWWVRR